jgi:hypothetical protein
VRKPKKAVAAALLASDKAAARRVLSRKRHKQQAPPQPLKPFGARKGADGKYRYGEGDLTVTYRLDVFTCATHGGTHGIRVKVYLRGWVGDDAGDEAKVFERTHHFEAGHDGEAMVRGYLAGRTPWWILADWLEDHADALHTLPHFVRSRVGLAFREYHERREQAAACSNHAFQTV